jgi:uncharacterized protein (UPF0333 family)
MIENRSNNSSVFLLFFLMIVFFSFIQIGREKHVPESSVSSFLASPANSSGPQAIRVPGTSAPEIYGNRINPDGKYTIQSCNVISEIIVRELIPGNFCSAKFNFLLNNPFIRLSLRQKIPGNEKSDDPIPVI